MAKNNAKILNLKDLIAAGIDPATGLPIRMGKGNKKKLADDMLLYLRIIDEQDAVNRGKWYNLPSGITSQELERLLYFKGQLAFFYFKELDSFYFMPYALDGTIDFYGRFNTIHPVPMTSGKEDEKSVSYKNQSDILSKLKLKCIYDVITDEDKITYELLTESCVLLHDYSKQLSQTIIPRSIVNDSLLQVMSEIIPYMRTNMIAKSGTKGVRVQDEDQQANVIEGSREVERASLEGDIFIPIIGTIDFQELTSEGKSTTEEYMLALQSLDNFRLAGYGIDNGGLFEKKAHELEVEAQINGGPIGLVMQDATSIRQNFCNIVNSIWGLGIWYEPSENITSQDMNGDGTMYDRDIDNTDTDDYMGGQDNA